MMFPTEHSRSYKVVILLLIHRTFVLPNSFATITPVSLSFSLASGCKGHGALLFELNCTASIEAR